ncbi:hypothetical protein GCM10028819_16190 [Spirosoma humi]
MNDSFSEGQRHPADRNTYTDDLAAWTEAAFDLFINFKKIRNCLKENEIALESEPFRNDYIGQCPRENIVTLVTVMQTALDTLLQELEQLSTVSQTDYKTNHTRLLLQTANLNQLNQQARKKLLLTTLSAT